MARSAGLCHYGASLKTVLSGIKVSASELGFSIQAITSLYGDLGLKSQSERPKKRGIDLATSGLDPQQAYDVVMTLY